MEVEKLMGGGGARRHDRKGPVLSDDRAAVERRETPYPSW
jgi:hypothetical protein